MSRQRQEDAKENIKQHVRETFLKSKTFYFVKFASIHEDSL